MNRQFKFLTLIVVLSLFFSTFATFPVSAALIRKGDGTQKNPFVITTSDELMSIRTTLGNYQYYVLANDIDLYGVDFSTAIGGDVFHGHFDGRGHTLSNIRITGQDNWGFWGQLWGPFAPLNGGTIENLNINGINIYNNYFLPVNAGGITPSMSNGSVVRNCNVFGFINNAIYSGLITAYIYDDYDYSHGVNYTRTTITDCNVSGSIYVYNNVDFGFVGGIVGLSIDGLIQNSSADIEIDTVDIQYVGGLVGKAEQKRPFQLKDIPEILNNEVVGSINTENAWYVGGVVGLSEFPIRKASFKGNINSYELRHNSINSNNEGDSRLSVGGIVGESSFGIRDSYVEAFISTDANYIGGIIGYSFAGWGTHIRNSYFSGNIFNQFNPAPSYYGFEPSNSLNHAYIGGLIGYTHALSIQDSYINAYIYSENGTQGAITGGSSYRQTINNVYFLGKLFGADLVSPVGYTKNNDGSDMPVRFFFDKDIAGVGVESPKEFSRSTEEMKMSSNYNSWDFRNTWEIEESQSYPHLKSLPKPSYIEEMDIKVTRLSETSVLLEWGGDWTHTNYTVIFEDKLITTYEPRLHLENLEPDVDYSIYIKYYQGAHGFKIFGANTFELRTRAAFDITTFEWDFVDGADGYIIDIESWGYFVTGDNFYEVWGLEANQEYELKFYAVSGYNWWSFTEEDILLEKTITVKTKAISLNLETTSTHDTILLKWDLIDGIDYYFISYGDNHFYTMDNFYEIAGLEEGVEYEITIFIYHPVYWYPIIEEVITVRTDKKRELYNEIAFDIQNEKIFTVALTANKITSFEDLEMEVIYDASALELVNFAVQTGGEALTVGKIAGTNLEIVNIEEGKVTFKLNENIQNGKTWSGLVTMLEFKAKTTANTTIILN